MRMKLYRKVVPFKLTVPFGEHGTFRTTQTGSNAFGGCDGELFCLRVVRPTRKAAVPGKDLIQKQCRRTAFHRERHNGDIGKVIGNVLTIYRHHTVQRLSYPINTECLRFSCIVGFSLDEPLFCYQLVMLTSNGVFEYAFKYTVSLLCDLTRNRIRERTQAKGGEAGAVCWV